MLLLVKLLCSRIQLEFLATPIAVYTGVRCKNNYTHPKILKNIILLMLEKHQNLH